MHGQQVHERANDVAVTDASRVDEPTAREAIDERQEHTTAHPTEILI